MLQSTLMLNCSAAPVSLIPISAVCWQDAINYLYADIAETLHAYENWFVHSPSMTIQVPAVCILKQSIPFQKHSTRVGREPVTRIVYLRDGYRCQYCLTRFNENDLTIDHVIPRSRGGKNTWDNVTTACAPCNARKGHKRKLKPATPPFMPSYAYLARMSKTFPVFIPHPSWNLYLGWEEPLVNIVGHHACR